MPKERGGIRNRDAVQDTFIEVSNDIDTKLLPKQVLAELRNISPKAADYVGKHLAAAMMALEDDDAERAYQHAIAARSQGSRLASVREMCGLAAYYNEKWAEALNEFRTYQRITGDPHFMPLMADCERGLGRPEKALNLAKSDQVRSLDADTRIEFRIVISGARADLNQFEAALATLECPELHSKKQSPAITRLRYAYANALQQLNRLDEARDWFVKTSLSDSDDLTDAAERAVLISEM
jgi:tetratricopeptide (TPR) repeat protein